MIRIGILGTDNSHSIGFSRFFNVAGEKHHISGAKVVAVYGEDRKRTEEVAEKGQIARIVKRPKDMIGMIDAAIVDFRHGHKHLRFARPLIEAGIPTFVDKPLASSVAGARKIVAVAKKSRVPITSFSTVRFGAGMDEFKKAVKKIGKPRNIVIWGPGDARDQYDGIFFYAVHQVELMLEVFGNDVCCARGVDYDGMLAAQVVYHNGMVATMHEINTRNYWPRFQAFAFGSDGAAEYDGAKAEDGFFVGAKTFTRMFQTGKMPYPYKDLTVSTRVLAAIDRSMKLRGKEVRIR